MDQLAEEDASKAKKKNKKEKKKKDKKGKKGKKNNAEATSENEDGNELYGNYDEWIKKHNDED